VNGVAVCQPALRSAGGVRSANDWDDRAVAAEYCADGTKIAGRDEIAYLNNPIR